MLHHITTRLCCAWPTRTGAARWPKSRWLRPRRRPASVKRHQPCQPRYDGCGAPARDRSGVSAATLYGLRTQYPRRSLRRTGSRGIVVGRRAANHRNGLTRAKPVYGPALDQRGQHELCVPRPPWVWPVSARLATILRMPFDNTPASASPSPPPPLVLVANDQEWSARTLESVLGQAGFAVVRAYTGRQAVDIARRTQPDAVILDVGMPDIGGIEVCHLLRNDVGLSQSTPIVMTTAGPASRALRLDALRAGAWELLGEPIDSEALLLKMGAFVQSKREIDRVGPRAASEGDRCRCRASSCSARMRRCRAVKRCSRVSIG
jgi:CheY-like chemotaxis protein